jgi:long-chain fatty acid transport protein
MKPLAATILVLAAISAAASGAQAQGLIFPSAGPINSSMAGASTAAPVDVGASYWNPATISALPRSEFMVGAGLFFPSTHLETALPAGSIGGIFPATSRFGTSRSDSGVGAAPAVAVAFRLDDDSPFTYGIGLFGLLGGNVNYPGSAGTPLLSPHDPPKYFGFGPYYANAAALALEPMVSYKVTDRISVGGGPIVTQLSLNLSPAFFAPGPPDALGIPSFPSASNSRPFWGGGFQGGVFYDINDSWNAGFSYKSPIWQERWGFNSTTPDLAPRRIGVQATIPEIFSWGVAYKGLPKTLLDVDFRYFDYGNASLFGQSVPDGGLGWRSIFAVAFGGQYQATERLTVRGGYLYNQNPIHATTTLFNVQLPGIITNTLSLGATLRLTNDIVFSVAWMHGFRNSIEGPILQIPGASVRFDTQVDTLLLGLNVQFGGCRTPKPAASIAAHEPIASPSDQLPE